MAPNNTELVLSSEKDVVQLNTNIGVVSKTQDTSMLSFFDSLSEIARFDTGLMPLHGTGVLSIRKALNHMQLVFQYQPGIYPIAWSAYERGTPKVYHLAQPWRIVIIDFINGNLLGGKQFYSPNNIVQEDQPLYHVNVPNTNCRGYGTNNAVGWTCIYRNKDISQYSMKAKIDYALLRMSGEETYNDANMSGTDGTRFYGQYSKNKFLSNPNLWQEKTANEGYQWTLDDSLWIPILVKGPDEQQKHLPGGHPLTLEWAKFGHYSAYYSDINSSVKGTGYTYKDDKTDRSQVAERKAFNLLDRKDFESEHTISQEIFRAIKTAFLKPIISKKKILNKGGDALSEVSSGMTIKKTYQKKCSTCNLTYLTTDDLTVAEADKLYWISGDFAQEKNISIEQINGQDVCKTCVDKIFICAICDQPKTTGKKKIQKIDADQKIIFEDDIFVCINCYNTTSLQLKSCQKCAATWVKKDINNPANASMMAKWGEVIGVAIDEIDADQHVLNHQGTLVCTKCTTIENCEFCKKTMTESYEIDTEKMGIIGANSDKFKLCLNCFTDHSICACKKLVSVQFLAELGDGTNACEGCIGYMPDGIPVWDPDHKLTEVIIDMGDFKAPDPDVLQSIDPNAVLEMPEGVGGIEAVPSVNNALNFDPDIVLEMDLAPDTTSQMDPSMQAPDSFVILPGAAVTSFSTSPMETNVTIEPTQVKAATMSVTHPNLTSNTDTSLPYLVGVAEKLLEADGISTNGDDTIEPEETSEKEK